MSANPIVDTDPTMAAIRSILHDEAPLQAAVEPNSDPLTKPKAALAASLRAVQKAAPKDTSKVEISSKLEAKTSEPTAAEVEADGAVQESSQGSRLSFKGERSNVSFIPKRKHAIMAGVLGIAFFRPSWIIFGLILFAVFVLAVFAVCGADRVWGFVIRLLERVAGRSPERAQGFVKRLDAFAMRWDGVLDRFPEGMVDGLYLPDFQSIIEAGDRHSAAINARLDQLRAEC